MALTTKTDSPDAYILQLPVELLEVAASHTQLEDIMSLRLACKELNHQLTRAYERVRYSKLTFYLANKYSMQTLENLSKHPTLDKYIKTIQLAEGQFILWSDRLIDRKDTLPHVRPNTREEKKALGAIRKVHNGVVYEQDAHLEQNAWQQYLTRALINIKTNVPNASVKIIALSAEDAEAHSVVGRNRMERLVGYKNCFQGTSDFESRMARSAQIVKAILDGACPISVLHLGTTVSPVIDSTLAGLKDHSEFATTFGSLTELHLYLRSDVDGSELATMLAKIPALGKLYLGSKWEVQSLQSIDTLLRQATLPALQDLDLQMHFRDVGPLVQFIRQNQQNLKQIKLSRHNGWHKWKSPVSEAGATRIKFAGQRHGIKVLVARATSEDELHHSSRGILWT
ncbi:hypothetical protein KC343_g6902 [Hortaea werneckii]|nr:hypothetical protein KC323_g8546 [Hortaea werneckii]KAI7157979.1 hypothetical protein KC352_g27312 [Hortaea werneckii]KAI7345960.1 hypothetical protein KC320_g8110 [Hortaea werneckii]KAI7571446.1 hypothetical protein KC317_g1619 [Hortaea werneckii]KAI7614717.1 hypothetical protein KC346_g6821 [Hortaea werneckii]